MIEPSWRRLLWTAHHCALCRAAYACAPAADQQEAGHARLTGGTSAREMQCTNMPLVSSTALPVHHDQYLPEPAWQVRDRTQGQNLRWLFKYSAAALGAHCWWGDMRGRSAAVKARASPAAMTAARNNGGPASRFIKITATCAAMPVLPSSPLHLCQKHMTCFCYGGYVLIWVCICTF